MPMYAYKGMTAAGKSVSATAESENPRALKASLRREGIFLTELKETRQRKNNEPQTAMSRWAKFSERVSTQELATATRQLSTLIGAGIPLVDSLIALIDQVDNPAFKSVWSDVKQRVNEGTNFADALSMHPRVFSGLYVNMIRAGESSGAFEVVLNRLADFTESQAELRSKLMGTMMYPIIMMFMAMLVVTILFVFVIPKIAKIFESQKVSLPTPTRLLIGLSSIMRNYGVLLIALLIGGAIFFRRWMQSEKGKPKWDKFVLKIPFFGELVRMIAVTRLTRTLSTLLGSGVPLLTAFDIVKNVVQNDVLSKVIENARESVKEGESIAAPLKRSGQFPPIMTHMIAIGEKSGELESMLAQVAKSYEVQVNARLQAATSILEPIMIVVMGVVVAFIVFSILMPMMQISSFA